MQIKELIIREMEREQVLKKRFKRELDKLEEFRQFRLRVRNIKGRNYYSSISRASGKEEYLGTSDSGLVVKLQTAAFCDKALKMIAENEKAADFFLKRYRSITPDTIRKALPESYRGECDKLVDVMPKSSRKWLNEMQEKKHQFRIYRPQDLKHKTIDGTMVRSKSEALIYNYLYQNGIPFIYECPLKTESGYIIPDFTIYDVNTGDVLYWEHLGMLYDEEYYSEQFDKLCKYSSISVVPMTNLIITVDDQNGGLDTKSVERCLRAFSLI